MIRVELPYHLRTLAGVTGELLLEVPPPVTLRRLLDVLEIRHPVLAGTIRDRATGKRRPLLRYYACRRDLSLEDPDAPLPAEVQAGTELFWIVGSVAGG